MKEEKDCYCIEKWKLCNILLNTLRQAKGLPLVPYTDNPYWLKNIKKNGSVENV